MSDSSVSLKEGVCTVFDLKSGTDVKSARVLCSCPKSEPRMCALHKKINLELAVRLSYRVQYVRSKSIEHSHVQRTIGQLKRQQVAEWLYVVVVCEER